MPKTIQGPDGPLIVPDDATDAEISALTKAIPAANAPSAPKARTWTALAAQGVAQAVPVAATGAMQLATSPAVPRAVASIGRAMGGAAPIVASPANPMSYLAASGGAWSGGKAGYFTGKLAQNLAAPAAKVLDAVAPYAQALSTASGAQGALDLAQMAEPDRKDIGTLGVTVGPPRTDEEKAAHPALINLAVEKVSDAINRLMSLGLPRGEAVRQVMNAKVKGS